ncbi:ABC transporter permease [Victivallis sp. Marseille-Q1083]|uniref:ABC transporter permease n=1 Tax=Victivallis sp. Marseille-Q1083 TaxID=2717288 RepID=UPI00158E37C1|nr:ABC transporter permease [Victivallis sp. Marseille-Q1083]
MPKPNIDIDTVGMIMAYGLFLPGLAIVLYYRLKLFRQAVGALIRMTLQLLLVGLYLRYIFLYNSFSINLLWVVLTMLAANLSTMRQTELNWRRFLLPTVAALALSFLPLLLYFLYLVARRPFADASITIPITGVLLGNVMRGNVTAVDRFYRACRDRENEYLCRLMLGATRLEALLPFLRDALHASATPFLAVMATVGIVTLPGVITGQLLGGTEPVLAIKYQIATMIGGFSVILCTSLLLILFTRPLAFLPNDRLREDVFRRKPKG